MTMTGSVCTASSQVAASWAVKVWVSTDLVMSARRCSLLSLLRLLKFLLPEARLWATGFGFAFLALVFFLTVFPIHRTLLEPYVGASGQGEVRVRPEVLYIVETQCSNIFATMDNSTDDAKCDIISSKQTSGPEDSG